MKMDEGDTRLLQPATERIIGRAFGVANVGGHGLVKKWTNPLHPSASRSSALKMGSYGHTPVLRRQS
jgi:hypothetical protein